MFSLVVTNFDLELPEDCWSRVPVIKFECLIGGAHLFDFIPEQGYTQWARLAEACAGGEYDLDWNCSNGDASISIQDGTATFRVEKSGNGCGGILEIAIPAADCAEGFTEAARLTSQWIDEWKGRVSREY